MKLGAALIANIQIQEIRVCVCVLDTARAPR